MDKPERTLFLVLALAAAALVTAVIILLPGDGDEQAGPTPLAGPAQPAADASQESPVSEEEAASLPEPAGEEEGGDAGKVALKPTGIFISGKVVDQKTGEPVGRYDFKLQRLDGNKWIDAVEETVRDGEGLFLFLLESGGEHRVTVRAPRYIPIASNEIDVPVDTGLADLVFELDPGLGVTGRVVDDATGAPVAGALVGPVTYAAATDLLPLLFNAETEWNHAGTDERGRFELRALTGDFNTMAAVHPAYAEGIAVVDFKRATDVEIRLKTGARVFGKAFDDLGKPIAGLIIRMTGGTTPLARAALTIQDGRFVLPPAVPGPLDVFAEPPHIDEQVFGFTKEKKSVDLRDRDKEIFFGPSPDHVTWRGRLFDCEGKPVPGGRLTVTPVRSAFSIYARNDGSREARCSEAGDFEVRKLAPDEYAVTLRLTIGSGKLDWNTVTFENPGVVKKDIHITGGVIKGMVVDSSTGKPLVGKGGHIFTRPRRGEIRWFSTEIDENGRFVLQGLPANRYQLDARVKGFPPAKSEELELDEDERIENLAVPVFLGGTWAIKFTGFLKTDPRDCTVTWSRDSVEGWHSKFRIDENGEKDASFEIETGKWVLEVKFEGWGTVEREFEILAGKTTEIVIQRDDVALGKGLVNAAVLLTWSDGAPVAGAKVQFFAKDMTSGGPGESYIYGTTDTAGRVDLTGFRPGEWRVMTAMPDNGHAELPGIEIPLGVSDPYVINLALPRGEVTGAFHDGRTGEPFGGDRPVWWVHLFDVRQNDYITSIQGGKGSRFRILGIAGGEYKLKLKARGYADRETAIFRLAEGESLDLGRIDMDPCGILDLEVVDVSGSPVDKYRLAGPGYQGRVSPEYLSPGRRRHFGFPIGDATIKIMAKGFKDQEFTVHLEPGRPVEARVVLERD